MHVLRNSWLNVIKFICVRGLVCVYRMHSLENLEVFGCNFSEVLIWLPVRRFYLL